uniref:Uncharacterized protein n=1 Tax=Cannabis sativa TaxID=3483 RepID=A0A803PXS8_CANSA
MSGSNTNHQETKCKIRKRNCSSSSSSSLVRKYRFKRTILMGKRGGSTTPAVTMWETTSSPAPVSMAETGKGKEAAPGKSVSARKLAATLWELNQKKDGTAKLDKLPKLPSQSASLPPDPSYTPISDRRRDDHAERVGHHRTMSAVTQKFQLTDYYLGGLDSLSTASLMEVEDHARAKTHHHQHHKKCVTNNGGSNKTRLKEVSSGLATSKELVKLLNHVCGLEEQRSLSTSLFSALRFELDRALIHVDRFMREQRSKGGEIEFLVKQFAEEKAAWRSKERERIREAMSCVAEELKAEKKLRKQTERLNKKIGCELADAKAALSKAVKELEREKRAKEILEQVCDELARGIGEDRAQVEELKRESEKVREEVEKERQMLQLADVLREERVQMKLTDAKYQFEEKNAAVEQLRNELETYLLNMDNNSRSYRWSYACGEELNEDEDEESRRVSVDRDFKGRKSISEKIQWGSICLNKSDSGLELDFGNKSQGNSDGVVSQAKKQEFEDEFKRYRSSIKGLADQILSGSEMVPIHGLTSPSRQWGKT